MKIGVLADTHIPGRAACIPDIVMASFNGLDHIIHAGDILSLEVIHELEGLAPVTAVAGNIDHPEIQEKLGFNKTVELAGCKLGVVHGHGSHGSTPDRAYSVFMDKDVDCIVFGHSHIPYCKYRDGVLLFNPGSPTDKRRNKYFSFGIIDIETVIIPHIIYFDSSGIIENRTGLYI